MKVLISRPDKIGDLLLALHGVKQLKLARPDIEIFFYVSPYTEKLAKNIKFIDGVYTTEDDLPVGVFDATVDLLAKYNSAKTMAKTKAKIRIGNSARTHSFLYNRTRHVRRSKAQINEAEYNWQLISLLDEKLMYSRLTETLSVDDFKSYTEYKKEKAFTVLMPSITASADSWPIENWISLAKQLAAKNSQKDIYFLLGPAEIDLSERILLETNELPNVQMKSFDSLEAVTGLLKEADYYIGGPTGITHMASLLSDKGIALYPEKRSMHPNRWLPFKTKFKAVSLSKKLSVQDVLSCIESSVPDELKPIIKDTVSGFIICCDEESNIRRALESLSWCDEIVVVDSGSKDKTVEIAKEYTDKVLHRDWTGYYEQKQFALDSCTKKWVINIDADEEVSMELRGQIEDILSKPKKAATGYNVHRLIFYLDRWWDKGGWLNEYRLRFFQKEHANWSGSYGHEKATLKGKARKLHGSIYHYTYRDIRHQTACLQKHAEMMADSMSAAGRKGRIINILLTPTTLFEVLYPKTRLP